MLTPFVFFYDRLMDRTARRYRQAQIDAHVDRDRRAALVDKRVGGVVLATPESEEMRCHRLHYEALSVEARVYEDGEVAELAAIPVADEWEIDCHRMTHRFAA